MSGTTDNTDPITALNSSIHLNEDDWLQFLQKLTPSSIENLQQTLKRLQQRESPIPQSDKLSFLATASQLCGSSIHPSSIADPTLSVNQTTPIVMSRGVSKNAVPSVITVPPVLSVAKSVPNAMSSTIVLPSSAVLITPSAHGQTFSLDSRAGMNRFFLTSEDLVHTSSGSTGSNVPSSSTEAFNSLNTLATAAVAVAASSSNQIPWSSEPGFSVKETASTDVVTCYPQVFDQSPSQSSVSSNPASSSCTISTNSTTAEGLLSSLCTAQRHDLSSQLLPSLSAAGITVYPVQVSANGPTVLVAAAPSSTVGAAAAKGLLSRNSQVSIPTSPLYTSLAVSMGTNPPTCCSASNTVGVENSTITSTTAYPCLLPTSFATTLFSSTPPPASAPTSILLPSLTPPRTKPKFKALWEPGLTGNAADSSSALNSIHATDSPEAPSHSVESNVSSSTSSTGLLLTPSPISGPNRSLNSDNLGKRQSPLLVGFKSIGQTPKRLAASAATQSDEEYKSAGQVDGSKKLLLVCSQSMLSRGVNSVLDTVETNKAARSGPADSDQSELVFLTNPQASLVGGGSERLVTVRPDSKSPVPIQPQPPPALFVRNRGATMLLVNHNSNGTNATTTANTTTATTNNQTNSGQSSLHQASSTNNAISSETEIASTGQAENMHGMDGYGTDRVVLDVCKRIMRDELDQAIDDEARRRAKRRERNRVAAAKCRQRRQDQIIELQHHVVALTKTGQELRSSIQSLDEESSHLKELIRQHGLAGCPAADDILAACITINEPLPTKDDRSTIMDTRDDDEEDELSLDHPTGAFENLDDVMMTISTSAAAPVAPYSNSGPTTSCSSPTSPVSRAATTKPDPELSDGMSRAIGKSAYQQRPLRTSVTANGVSMPTIKPDPFDAVTAERSPVTDSGSDVSDSKHMRTSLRSSCHSPPAARTRLSAARPCTLLPLKRSLEPVSTISTAMPNSTMTTTTPKSSTVTTPVEVTTIGSNTINAQDTPVIPCFWPSELHNFSPILTPSAWKVLLKDWGPGTSICTTPATSTMNLTAVSSSSPSPNPSAAAAAAAALFLTSPTLSSSLTSPCATTNLLVNSLVNSIQNAAAAVAAAGGGATVLTTPCTTNAINPSANSNSNSICSVSIGNNTPLLGLAEAISAATATTTANSKQSPFVLSPEQQPQQHTGEELNATTTQ